MPSLAMTPADAPALPTHLTPDATSNESPIASAQAHDKPTARAVNDWSVEDVANWLKREGFDQDICEKFVGEPISFSFIIPMLHMR